VGVERRHVVGRGALLRTEDGGGAGRPEERVRHVAEDHRAAGRQRSQPGEVDGGDPPQRAAAGADRSAVVVDHPGAQGGQRTRPAVRRRAAAQGEEHPFDPVVQCRGDRLAEPSGVRVVRPQPVQQRDAARRGELDDACPVRQQHPVRRDVPAVRPLDGDRHAPGVGERREEGVQRALTAVGHGHGAHDVLGPDPRPPPGQRGGGLRRARAALERVRGDDDTQRVHAARVPRAVTATRGRSTGQDDAGRSG
jgi:hypothetical protein